MCGGPAIKESSGPSVVSIPVASSEVAPVSRKKVSASSLKHYNCLELGGMIEGIVPLEYEDDRMKGLASIIDAPELRSFLTDVNSNKIANVYIGGEPSELMGGDLDDPDQLDVAKVIEKYEKEIDSEFPVQK